MKASQFEYVFGDLDADLQGRLKMFWSSNREHFQAEIRETRTINHQSASDSRPIPKTLLRQPAALAYDDEGNIIGMILVALRELDENLQLGSHAYFQRMYVKSQYRNFYTSNQLFSLFLPSFEASAKARDHRARYLVSENVNPGLHKPPMRRYFARHGFQLIGGNQSGSEIWIKKLKTLFVF